MSLIQQFQEIRRDGKVVDESMTGLDMIRAGWAPDKVLVLRWMYSDRLIELRSPFGLLSRIVATREYIVVLEDTDAGGQYTTLTTYLPDGTPHMTFQNIVPINNHPEAGIFASFRSPESTVPTAFSVLFDVYRNGGRFQVEIDAVTGNVLGAHEVR